MFNWLKSKNIKPEHTDAYKKGQAAAQSISYELEKLMQSRYGPVFDGYISVLKDGLHKSFNNPDAPALVLARIQFDIFLENVSEMKSKMIPEIYSYMEDWVAFSKEIGMGHIVDDAIAVRVDDYLTNLQQAGLDLLENSLPMLKDNDSLWRKKYPERASEFQD